VPRITGVQLRSEALMKTLWLPGAAGSSDFWWPVAESIRAFPQVEQHRLGEERILSWPGLGREPTNPAVRGLSDLVQLLLSHMDQPVRWPRDPWAAL
jgi:hypothetical protein